MSGRDLAVVEATVVGLNTGLGRVGTGIASIIATLDLTSSISGRRAEGRGLDSARLLLDGSVSVWLTGWTVF
jgi:hypothetical protein